LAKIFTAAIRINRKQAGQIIDLETNAGIVQNY